MNTTHSLENNSTLTNTTTSCDTEAPIRYLLSMLFSRKKFELASKSSNSSDFPGQEALTEQINQAEICVKQALKKYNPKN